MSSSQVSCHWSNTQILNNYVCGVCFLGWIMSPNQTYCPIFPKWWLENWQMGKVGNQDCAIAAKILCPDCPRAARRSHTGGEVSPDVWNRVFALAPLAAFVLPHTCVRTSTYVRSYLHIRAFMHTYLRSHIKLRPHVTDFQPCVTVSSLHVTVSY